MSVIESKVLPMLPLREEVVFPMMKIPFFIGRKSSMDALEKALSADRQIFVVTQKKATVTEPKEEDLFEIGTVGKIIKTMRLPNNTVKTLYEAKKRARVLRTQLAEGGYLAHIEIIEEEEILTQEFEELAQKSFGLLHNYFESKQKNVPDDLMESLENTELIHLADTLVPLIDLSKEHKQYLLECLDSYERLLRVCSILEDATEIRKLEGKLKKQVQEQVKSAQKDDYLQDQLRSIQKELGQTDDSQEENEKLRQKIETIGLSEEAKEVAEKELKKLKMMSPMSSEANVVRNYLDWLTSMPWSEKTEDNFDLDRAQTILDEDHYGLQDVKERIIEYLAVANLKNSLKGPIICLVGPPGVGKTSLAQSIARALDRNFVRMTLGGVRDEAEIRGHRRTYIGAMPGKIIQSIRKAKSNNPVLLMDEIDKLYQSAVSDPSAALLEVLDPEQNNTFMDHFLEVEYDLSDVLFLCTANSVQQIPTPLLDRMELITLSGYTEIEKKHIASRFLVPKQCEANGLKRDQLKFRDNSLQKIIQHYTREAGVRSLEREIGKVCRKTVTQLLRKKEEKNVIVTPKVIKELLGVPPFEREDKHQENTVGLTIGLSVSSIGGGDIMMVECGLMPGTGKLSLTGKLGDVLQESAQAAYSYIQSNANSLGISKKSFQNMDLHIHLPEGATPKDGPSAGVALITSIVSVFTKIPVRHDVAMTGEITLRGHVKEIGGLKEKLLAAKRSGIREVLIPEENQKDLPEIPQEIKKDMIIHEVTLVDQALHLTLERYPTAIEEEDSLEVTEQTKETLDENSEVIATS